MPKLWSINALSDETGIDRRTLKKLLDGVTPAGTEGKSALYRLRDLVEALRRREDGGAQAKLLAEKARLTEADADIREMERAVKRGQLVETAAATAVMQNIAMAVARIAKVSGLPEKDVDRILAEFREGVQSVAKAMMEQREFTEPAEKSG